MQSSVGKERVLRNGIDDKQGQREMEGEYHMRVDRGQSGLVHVQTAKCLYSLRQNLMLFSPFFLP